LGYVAKRRRRRTAAVARVIDFYLGARIKTCFHWLFSSGTISLLFTLTVISSNALLIGCSKWSNYEIFNLKFWSKIKIVIRNRYCAVWAVVEILVTNWWVSIFRVRVPHNSAFAPFLYFAITHLLFGFWNGTEYRFCSYHSPPN